MVSPTRTNAGIMRREKDADVLSGIKIVKVTKDVYRVIPHIKFFI